MDELQPTEALRGRSEPEAEPEPQSVNRFISVPFADWDSNTMSTEIEIFIEESGLSDYSDYIRRGAYLAQDKNAFPRNRPRPDGLKLREDKDERKYLDLEYSSRPIDRFNQPWRLYALVVCCSLGAAVQGWDETAINGAQIFYQKALGIEGRVGLIGLVNSAPYLCCAISCWLNYPLNKVLGRRGVIFLTCIISSVTCLGQAFPRTWYQLFIARLLLGLGIGPKSATIPIYAAECAPANIRGALVMMWQMWTAFGLMCGYISGVVLRNVNSGNEGTCDQDRSSPDHLLSSYCSLNWRLMLASPMVLPLFVVAYIYTMPESPRFLLRKARNGDKKKYEEAFNALCSLRYTKLQAARDMFLIHHLLKGEERIMAQQQPFRELFSIGRNRRALGAAVITMFFQQFCGVNVMAYYSSSVLVDNADFSQYKALLASMGFGIINFLFAIPAIWTIDTFGRRNLLLSTFPFMALFQGFLAIGFAFDGTTGTVLIMLGMYLFSIAYSPGEGPVPFVYSAECLPLYNRDFGMGIVTSINWFFNFFLAITWPKFLAAFGASGAFAWYAGWCVAGWWIILLFLPETKDLTLEQLDEVFEISTREHARHGMDQLVWWVRRWILKQKGWRKPVLIQSKIDEGYEIGGEEKYARRPIGEMIEDS
ncbi:sugar transporter family protein [Patellaria atrata CBS 101060]|uniref:Sugar transporter family protein n=1 Tax=Patellaria atrata CBS 101060 TaxID=1346257 RepID=A0A9P4S265_9PEZI|nr:sugar transporter family protein [Patellaria atrata CBS 101060]